ncbi:MAG: IS200/IS605 family transposase [Planctomycetes bacterium]|jgi:REP element-mobilizing transposase RayT|nr:IS200/IS605 family transposase [Planctomycetota bacterium]
MDVSELARVIGGICGKQQAKLLAANGFEDHVHMLVSIRPKEAVADLVRNVKSNTSSWIHNTVAGRDDFAWQSGYSVFSVSRSAMDEVKSYIERQATHHREMSFEEELLALLERHGIEYDPRYVLNS